MSVEYNLLPLYTPPLLIVIVIPPNPRPDLPPIVLTVGVDPEMLSSTLSLHGDVESRNVVVADKVVAAFAVILVVNPSANETLQALTHQSLLEAFAGIGNGAGGNGGHEGEENGDSSLHCYGFCTL
jgi:hypothetical protein